ncbi:NADH-quinone oxidoreductase subunit C [Saccharicrinis sp. FJH62]|uniref:NADH-quinone oxidoreductase subunit C n=1 Tax=Saccharicrinis sp. FJH62 TaxID=3344657 RepID=UPI0035D52963
MEKIIERLRSTFEVMAVKKQRDDLYFVTVPKDQAISVVTHLRDMEGFSHLVMITVVDWNEKGIFKLNYIVHNHDLHADISIVTNINRENATMHSAHHLWAQAWTYQRELKEMYGIDFPGSPRVDENFVLEGWDNVPPMRRDFDTLKYSEETYFQRPGRMTHDPATYMKQKLYPDE